MKKKLIKVAGNALYFLVAVPLSMGFFEMVRSPRWPISVHTLSGLVSSAASPVVGIVMSAIAAVLAIVAISALFALLTSLLDRLWAIDLASRVFDVVLAIDDHFEKIMAVLWALLFPVGTGVWLLLSSRFWPNSLSVTSSKGAMVAGLLISIWIGAGLSIAELRRRYFGAKVTSQPAA